MKSVNDFKNRTITGTGLMICSGVIALALPRLISSAFALHPQVAYQLSQETKLSTEIYQNAIDDLNLALAWHQSAYQWQEQAYFYLKLYNSQPVQDAEKRREQLNSAQTALSQGLALSPIDPFGWFMLLQTWDQNYRLSVL